MLGEGLWKKMENVSWENVSWENVSWENVTLTNVTLRDPLFPTLKNWMM